MFRLLEMFIKNKFDSKKVQLKMEKLNSKQFSSFNDVDLLVLTISDALFGSIADVTK